MKTIADFLGVSLDYLLTGQEAPVRKNTTQEEDDLLALFRSLPEPKNYFYYSTQIRKNKQQISSKCEKGVIRE